jgi:glucokinase
MSDGARRDGELGTDPGRGTGRDADKPPTGIVAGIDIGGTKIAVLIVDADGGVLGRATHAASVGDQAGAPAAIAAALDEALAAATLRRDDLDAIGVGVPGRVDPVAGHVTLAVNLGWTDFDLRGALEAELGRPVIIENDARAAALGLHRRRVADGRNGGDLAYLAVGTGIAAGVVLGGKLHRGTRGLAGEIGHAIVDPVGPRCACGQAGCLEAFASGPSIARRAAAAGMEAGSAKDVYAAAAGGDTTACELVDDVGRRLAWAVHLLVMTYDVDHVVVGGGVSHAGAAFAEPIHQELERLRAVSSQAGELLPAHIVEVLPPEAEPGAWGAVAVANAVRDPDRPRGTEVVRHA